MNAIKKAAALLTTNKNYARQGARLDALRNVAYQINEIIGQYKIDRVEDERFRMSLDDSSVGKRIAAEYFSDLKDTRPDPLPRPSTSVKLHSHYSGLIVDCRQLQIFRTLNPIIAADNDVVIFGAHNVGYDILIAQGLVQYSKDINDRLRVGNKPLIVKAVARGKGDHPIVSRVDVDKILAADLANGFLARAAVMFVI